MARPIDADDIHSVTSALIVAGALAVVALIMVTFSPGHRPAASSTPVPGPIDFTTGRMRQVASSPAADAGPKGASDTQTAPPGDETNRDVRSRGMFHWGH